MNILITAPSLNPAQNIGGLATLVKVIIEKNNQQNYFHYLLGKPDQPINKIKWLVQIFIQILKFPFFVKKNKIELVHQNLPLDPKGILREYFIQLWCRFLCVPVVLHVHGGKYIIHGTNNIIYKKIAQKLFKNSKQVIVLSELEKDVLKEKFGYKNSIVLSNSIDSSIYDSNSPKQLNELPKLLFLGRIEKNKGIVELVDALKLLKNEFNFQFILCGTGPLTKFCIAECSNFLGVDFEYKGVVSGIDKINTIKDSDIFILPSYFEGLPMALLETMSAGVVPVVTKVGSMNYIINNGINGLLIEKQDAQDLYEKLKQILSDKKLYSSLSISSRKTIVERYDLKKYLIQLNKIYDSAIKNSN